MTDRVEALRALLKMVKAGKKPSNDGILYTCFGDNWIYPWDILEGIGDLGEAEKLHNVMLPGWDWSTAVDAHNERWFVVGDGAYFETEEVYGHSPAWCWLIAIIEALIWLGLKAEQEGEGA